MTESEFHRAVDALLERIEAAASTAGSLDADLEGGVLTLACADGSRVIVNRQTPTREVWVAARAGGFHFRFDGAAWRDTRSGEELFEALARLVHAQCAERLEWRRKAP